MPSWNAGQYLKFERERTQPAIDLANRIPLEAPERVLDVGCGPENSTRRLLERFPNAAITGVDNSEAMLAAARETNPGLTFSLCDAAFQLPSLGAGRWDVVFSNACIQWVPDHPKLLRDMLGLLRKGGILAVQTPMNYEEPIHKIIGGLAASPRWADRFSAPRIFYNLAPGAYYDLLAELSADFSIWQTTYFHRMASHADILEWYRGTGLRPYLDALSPGEGRAFEQEVLAEVEKAYPVRENGEIIFRFPRLFFVAEK